MINLEQFKFLLDHYGAKPLCNKLQPLLTENRLTRIEAVLSNRIANLQVALECPGDLFNASAVKRSAEALGVDKIHVIQAHSDHHYIRGIMQGSGRWVETYRHGSLEDFIQQNNSNILLAGASPHATKTLDDIPLDQPICLLFGNERDGLSDTALSLCDINYKIPMYGMTESFNLSVSTALSIYQIGEKLRKQGKTGIYTPEETQIKRALYYCRSTNPRIIAQMLKDLAAK